MTARPTADWIGADLGTRTVTWQDRDAILYALAVGARPGDLDLVWEDRLHVLPPFALTLGQWAPDVLGSAGAFDVTTAVQGAQRLQVLAPMPPSGSAEMTARVAAVWDKGASAVFEVEVSCPYFVATWSLFCPGVGGFGGDRGPARTPGPEGPPDFSVPMPVAENAAVLYRLLGDRHAIHVDPAAAAHIGAERPILHGLATLGQAVLTTARVTGQDPWTVRELTARFSGMVLPGEELVLNSWADGSLQVLSSRGPVIDGARLQFG